MSLQGKGFFILDPRKCADGQPDSILAEARAAGLSHVIIRIAAGESACGLDASGLDLIPPLVIALHTSGIAVWGSHSIQGNDPAAEANLAISRTRSLGLDGFVVEVNDGFSRNDASATAHRFMASVRAALAIPIALSSYRFPNYHPELPWSTFLEFCDLHMPLVTWEQAHDAGAQLRESKRQCDALPNARPFIPSGPAYASSGWSPSVAEILEFLNSAEALGLPAVNFYCWEACQEPLPLVWTAIADCVWSIPSSNLSSGPTPSAAPLDEFLVEFLAALNSCQPTQASALYNPDAIQVRADQILPGNAAIQAGFTAFFKSLPAGSVFSISSARVDGDSRQFTWKAASLAGDTTLILQDRKIILDYTFMV
jgi:hypothetical protein